MKDLFEFLDGIARFLQGLVEFNELFSWGGSKKTKRNALQSNGPQPQTGGGCFLRSLGCLLIVAVLVLGALYLTGTFLPPPKPTPANPTLPSPAKPTSPSDIKIPKLSLCPPFGLSPV